MKISDFFTNIILTNDQNNALKKIEDFLVNDEHIFMLKGYAGTGKTTLIAGLVKFLNKTGRKYEVMAPTGRAARILKNKTGKGTTIHKCIYQLEKIDVDEKIDSQENTTVKINFPIRPLENENSILIVDECSMVSSKESKQAILKFGSDILLKDLLDYAQIINKKTKIIFVGDPAQLLPVGDNKSWAFEKSLFISKNFSVNEYELKEIKRQEKNLILENSIIIRNAIDNDSDTELLLNFDKLSFEKINSNNIVSTFVNEYPLPELNSSVVIAYSNSTCHEYNTAIRKKYFPNNPFAAVGDIIQIVNNSYIGPLEISNGDFAKIIDINNSYHQITSPIYVDENDKRVKKIISLNFRDVVIKLDSYSNLLRVKIVDNLLYSQKRDLSHEEQTAIYLNFIIRFQEEQKQRKDRGLEFHKLGSKYFKEQLINDPYVNALRCKFGYAITCHKAQGGEWDKVFVDYTRRVSLKKDPLRWCYTATTRGVSKVYAINPPHFSKFKKFELGKLTLISKIPKEAIVFNDVTISPFHDIHHHPCKSQKYWDVLSQLENTDYVIKSIESKEYYERYIIVKDNDITILEGYHNGSGYFEKHFKLLAGSDTNLLKIFNQPPRINYKINYTPSTIVLEELYSNIQSICLDLDIYISNVVENLTNNYINYYFLSGNYYSNIQFYINKDGNLTKALPKTNDIINDIKFLKLLDTLKKNITTIK